jgi:hypothetical protein
VLFVAPAGSVTVTVPPLVAAKPLFVPVRDAQAAGEAQGGDVVVVEEDSPTPVSFTVLLKEIDRGLIRRAQSSRGWSPRFARPKCS